MFALINALIKFLFVFFLGWMAAVWIYSVELPLESLQDSMHHKVESIKNAKLFGMRLFEKEQGAKDISLPKELNP